MKKLIILYLTLGVFTGAFSQSTQINKAQSKSLVEIDEFITDYMAGVHKPGMSACIIKGDSVVWRGNYGYAEVENEISVTKNRLFYAYSIGKSITAASIMKLWENGIVGLDENVNGFLPFQIDNPNFAYDSITPRMLMTHTSSILDYNLYGNITIGDPTLSLNYFLENYLSNGGDLYNNANFSNNTPGTYYSYSNFGSALNGYLAETLLDTSFKDYAKDSLLLPLQMENSAWFLDDIDLNNLAVGYQYQGNEYVPYPNYGHPAYPGMTLKSSSEELSHFLIMLMNGGSYNDLQVLESNTVDTMRTPHMNVLNTGLGLYKELLNCENESKTIWGHKGGGTNGYASELQFCPDENIGVIYMSNSENYALSVLKKLFEYGALIVVPEEADNISETSFSASWQVAPDAIRYYIDVAYDWQFSSFVEGYENLDVGLDTTIDITGLTANTKYYYRITADNGLELGPASSSVVTTTLYEGSEEKDFFNDFTCYPNPADEKLTLSLSIQGQKNVVLSIYSSNGQKMMNEIVVNTLSKDNEFTLDISTLNNGICFLQINVDGRIVTKKFIKY